MPTVVGPCVLAAGSPVFLTNIEKSETACSFLRGRWGYGMSSRDGHGIVDLTLRHGTARRRLHCQCLSLPPKLRQRRCGTFDLISDCQVQALHADLSHRKD